MFFYHGHLDFDFELRTVEYMDVGVNTYRTQSMGPDLGPDTDISITGVMSSVGVGWVVVVFFLSRVAQCEM